MQKTDPTTGKAVPGTMTFLGTTAGSTASGIGLGPGETPGISKAALQKYFIKQHPTLDKMLHESDPKPPMNQHKTLNWSQRLGQIITVLSTIVQTGGTVSDEVQVSRLKTTENRIRQLIDSMEYSIHLKSDPLMQKKYKTPGWKSYFKEVASKEKFTEFENLSETMTPQPHLEYKMSSNGGYKIKKHVWPIFPVSNAPKAAETPMNEEELEHNHLEPDPDC